MGGIFGKSKLTKSMSHQQTSKFNASPSYDQQPARYTITPFIFKRWSSMYVDEDGDVAHEFYVEPFDEQNGPARSLRKVDQSRLKPQGFIEYDIPRLHPALPYIMVEVGGLSDTGE